MAHANTTFSSGKQLSVGTICVLRGLQKFPEKNGTRVKIIGSIMNRPDEVRYPVVVLKNGQKAAIKAENLYQIGQFKNFSRYYTKSLQNLQSKMNRNRWNSNNKYNNNYSRYSKQATDYKYDKTNDKYKQLSFDLNNIFSKECFYLPNLVCDEKDFTLFNKLRHDVLSYHTMQTKHILTGGNTEPYDSSNHSDEFMRQFAAKLRVMRDEKQKQRSENDFYKASMQCYDERIVYENPKFSLIFSEIVTSLCDHFNVKLVTCLMNYYKNNQHWSKYHYDKYKYRHDSSNYNNNYKNNFNKDNIPNITIGVSFGHQRDLSFLHVLTNESFDILQKNGDVFAFTQNVNSIFKHGVPKVRDNGNYHKNANARYVAKNNNNNNKSSDHGRISIIIWGVMKTPPSEMSF